VNLEHLSRQFLESLRVRHFSAATVASRRGGLHVFFGWLAMIGITDMRDVGRQTVRNYQLWLQESGYARGTVATRMQAVHRFFEYLEATDVLLANPCASLPALRLPPRLPRRILSLDEAARILATPDTDTPVGQRDRAILEVFYSSGLRLSELTALQISDLDLEGGFVRVTAARVARSA
jgi:integrase/recombinase XerD